MLRVLDGIKQMWYVKKLNYFVCGGESYISVVKIIRSGRKQTFVKPWP